MKTLAACGLAVAVMCLVAPQTYADDPSTHGYTVLSVPRGTALPYGTAQISICKALVRAGGIKATGPFPELSAQDIATLTKGKVTQRSVRSHADPIAFCHDAVNAVENRHVPGRPNTPLTRTAYFGLSPLLRRKADAAYKHDTNHQLLVLTSELKRIAELPLFAALPRPVARPEAPAVPEHVEQSAPLFSTYPL